MVALGFTTDRLPSGRLNLCHKDRFIVNGFTTMTKKDGQWFKTFEKTNDIELYESVYSIDFME